VGHKLSGTGSLALTEDIAARFNSIWKSQLAAQPSAQSATNANQNFPHKVSKSTLTDSVLILNLIYSVTEQEASAVCFETAMAHVLHLSGLSSF